jgi:hypothetical protein
MQDAAKRRAEGDPNVPDTGGVPEGRACPPLPHLQRLPLPVGSPHPVRRPARRQRGRPPLLALAGLLAAGAGAVLGAAPPTVQVGLDGRGYVVGTAILPDQGGGVYAGPQGAVILAEAPGETRAAASTHLHGVAMVGACRLPRGEPRELCTFQMEGRALACTDWLRAGGWDRRCADGTEVRIELAGGRPLAVPIAFGR